MSHQYLKAMLTFWYKSFKKPKFNRTKYKNSFKIFYYEYDEFNTKYNLY